MSPAKPPLGFSFCLQFWCRLSHAAPFVYAFRHDLPLVVSTLIERNKLLCITYCFSKVIEESLDVGLDLVPTRALQGLRQRQKFTGIAVQLIHFQQSHV